MEKNIKLRIDTPIGELEVYTSTDPNYPGFYVDFQGESVALIEFNSKKGIRTLAWEKNKEDYSTETIYDEDFSEPTEEDERIKTEWFSKGEFLTVEDREYESKVIQALHDGDFRSKKYKELFNRCSLEEGNPQKLYVYTLTEEDGIGIITEGYHFINRVGYFFSKKHSPLKEPFRYW